MQKETENPKQAEAMKVVKASLIAYKEAHESGESTFSNIQKTQNRIKKEGKLRPHLRKKYLELSQTGLKNLAAQKSALESALAGIHEAQAVENEETSIAEQPEEPHRRGARMKVLQQEARTLPLWIASKRVPAPPLCGAIPAEPSYIAKDGDKVAALVKGSDGDENWVLAKVISYSRNKYEVKAIDEEQEEKHVITKKRVIPLPLHRANPEMNPGALFKKGALVLAMYPQTTCFCRAVVHEPPSSPTDEYQVLFEDTSSQGGHSPAMSVPQRYVLCRRESTKK